MKTKKARLISYILSFAVMAFLIVLFGLTFGEFEIDGHTITCWSFFITLILVPLIFVSLGLGVIDLAMQNKIVGYFFRLATLVCGVMGLIIGLHIAYSTFNNAVEILMIVFGAVIIGLSLLNILIAIYRNYIEKGELPKTASTCEIQDEALITLERLADLHKKGILTDEEYEQCRKKTVSKII